MNSDTDTPAAPLGFLSGGGEMARRIREFGWSATPFGSAAHWPQSLRSALSICLGCGFPIAIYWGRELALLYNDAWSPIPGDKHPWALGRPAREVWPEIWGEIGPLFAQVRETGEPVRLIDQLLPMHRRGFTEECYFDYTFSPIRDEAGAVGGIFNAAVETTTRVLAERRARLLRDLAAGTVDAPTPDSAATLAVSAFEGDPRDLPFTLLYLVQPDGSVRLTASSGLSEDALALIPAQLGSNDAAWPFKRSRQVADRDGVVLEADALAPFREALRGGPWPEPAASAVLHMLTRAAGGEMAGIFIAGLSPRLALDEEYRGFIAQAAGGVAAALERARSYAAERERAEKLAEIDRAKTAFFSNVSHEFRTPLTLLLSPLEEIVSKPAGEVMDDNRRLATLAHRNGLRLLKLVNALLDFSRIEAGRAHARFEPTDLAAYTAELASSFRSAMEKAGLDFVVECPSLPEPVPIDREMWEKVVLNLLSNAFKFTLSGEVRVTLRALSDAVELTVRDTGTGIPDEARAHLFERFYRVENALGRTHEGSGIGLALVHDLVKLHGGSVRVESEVGAGSAFIVTVPRGPKQSAAAQNNSMPAASAGSAAFVAEALRWLPDDEVHEGDEIVHPTSSSPRPHVLLADDNADMREYICRLLSPRFEVVAVGDGEAALAAALDEPPALVLTDVMMPRLDGFGLLRALRADPALHAVPVIMLSARAGEEARVEGLDAGADDYLTKPFNARELLAKVSSTLTLARVRAEAQAREAELRAERAEILDRMNLAFIVLDEEYRIVYLNAEAGRLHGMTPEKYLGRSHWEAFPASLGTVVESSYRRAMTERVAVSFENFYEPWKVWFEVNAYPMSDGRLGVFFRDITESKRLDEEVRRSEGLYRAIGESIDYGVWVCAPDGRNSYASESFLKLVGITQEQCSSFGWGDVLYPDDAEGTMAAWQECVRHGGQWDREHRFRGVDGQWHSILARGVPVKDDQGQIFCWAGINLDITARKRAEEALAQSAEQLRLIADTAPVLIAHCDREHRYKFVNAPYAERFGLQREQLLGRHIAEVVGPAAYESIRGYMERVLAGEAVEFEVAIPYEKLGNHFMRCAYAPERNASGEVVGLVAAILDITERKRMEEALQQNEALFSTIIEQAPGGVYVVDDAFRVLQVNALARPTFAAAEPIIGRDFGEVMHILWGPEIGTQLADIFRHTLKTGERYISPRFTEHRPDLGVEKSYDWETQRITLPNGKCGVVCYFTDTTEQYAQEAALREAKDAAELANASKDRFLAVLSHELRTPLTPVLMAIGALEHDPELRPDVREDLAMMKRNVELETKLIDDLLDLNRITSGKLPLAIEPVDLNEALSQVCATCRPPLLEKGIRLETTLDEAAGWVAADAARLQQVLWNVLKNAIKFTPEKGTIRVTTKRLDDARCEVRIHDSGMGIPPEVLPRVFDAFEQGNASVTRQFGGLGLGLAICKALLELHRGSIRAESAGSGLGSTFIIGLPGTAQPSVHPPADSAPTANGQPQQLRLLLVEDHADTARTLSRLLRGAGYAVLTASDVASATATAEREPFDLLVSDLGLPDGNGMDIMRVVRAKRRVPGIAMSGYGMDEDVRRSREAGFTEHLVKPVNLPQLLAAIRRVTDERKP